MLALQCFPRVFLDWTVEVITWQRLSPGSRILSNLDADSRSGVFRFPESQAVRRMAGRGRSERLTVKLPIFLVFGRLFRAFLDFIHNELAHFGPHVWIELQFCMAAF